MKYTLQIELETDDALYGTDRESVDWLAYDILLGGSTLSFHSDEIGDEVGVIKVLSIEVDGRVITNDQPDEIIEPKTYTAPYCECFNHSGKLIDMTWDEYHQYDYDGVRIVRADCPYTDRAAIDILYENDRFLVYQDKE